MESIGVSALQTWEKFITGSITEDPHKNAKSRKENLADKVSLYQGDITRLEVDAIVNAGNENLTGGSGGNTLK